MRLLLALAATGVAAALCEVAYRALRPAGEAGLMYFRNADRVPFEPIGASETDRLLFQAGIQAVWPHPTLPPADQLPPTIRLCPAPGDYVEWFGTGYAPPRPGPLPTDNVTWLPDSRWFICYRGPQQPYFDADGCVEYRFNAFGLRDRTDLTLGKPAGTRRVVCLGDSLALGWGVRQDHNWPVLVERALRRRAAPTGGAPVQVVNCGGAGSSYADEYEQALRHRHGRFEPDVVLVSLCLNDLLITNGKLCHYDPSALGLADLPASERRWWMASRLLFDLSRGLAAATALQLDPDRDWVQELIDLPADHVWYASKGESPAVYWRGGAPQRALRGIRDWCRDHGARPAVMVWPLLQGLAEGDHYPFAKMHALVGELCAREGIAFLDLLPPLHGHDPAGLWVSPADMHPDEFAQTLVAPSITDFLADLLGDL